MDKQNPRLDILARVMELELSKGHLKWKVSDLARLSRVSRPLIYYHFGNTKAEILAKSLELIAAEYYGLNEERTLMLKEGRALESLKRTRRMFETTPALAVFYLKWRTTKSPMQKSIIAIEKRYQKKLREVYPHLSEGQIMALHAVFHGLVTAPFLNEEGFLIGVALAQKLVNGSGAA